MSTGKQEKVLVACPHCGHRQSEPPSAVTTVCRDCRGHFSVQEVLHPVPKPTARTPEQRQVVCFDCGTPLDVPTSAESTMCKRCGRYVDLKDYRITSTISKNFKTRGTFVVEPKGYVLNSETFAGEAVIKGRFLGRLIVERSLTIHSTADIRGGFKAAHLIIPPANHFHWKETIQVTSAEISGELANDLRAETTVVLKSTGRLFGDLETRNLVVEEGAVLVGRLRVGSEQK